MLKVRVLLVLLSILTTLVTLPSAQAQTYTLLYSFTGGADGGDLGQGTLARDAKGNLYGTALAGGDLSCPDAPGYGCGVVFKLDVTGHLSVPHTFTGGAQGVGPTGLLWDGKGNLYGATISGGDDYSCVDGDGFGCGLVFKVDKTGNYTVLYNFAGGADGATPQGSRVRDATGNLYDVTVGGGSADPSCDPSSQGCGTVFKLSPTGQHTILYSFTDSSDGWWPRSVIRDGAGNLYGITQEGGGTGCNGVGCGTIFKLDTTGKKTTLHSFTGGTDGGYGYNDYFGSLARDSAGNLYGTTPVGGDFSCPDGFGSGCGVVFRIDKKGKETVLHNFAGGSQGSYPVFGLVRDAAGNLYGTTENFCGTVFKFDTAGSLTTLHTFVGGTDGCQPNNLIQDAAGNLYGSTEFGGGVGSCSGQQGCGTVFKITLYPVSFSPESLTFSAQTVGTTSAPKTVTLFNNQSVALNITSIAASADYSAVPGGTKPCGSAVAANSSCTFVVRFSPTKIGTIKGAVTVTDDAPTSPQTVALTGKGK